MKIKHNKKLILKQINIIYNINLQMYYKIQYNDTVFIVKNEKNEPINMFYDRWFFISKYITNNISCKLDDVIILSYIYINVKYYQCRYPIQLYKKIESYLV